jgi:hypothetical protein
MSDIDRLILNVLQQAARPVTIREIALDVGRILGSSVDKKQIDGVLRGNLRELILMDACRRWRLAARTDLCGTVPRAANDKERADKERRVSGIVFDSRGRHAELTRDDPTVKSMLEWAAELDAEKMRLQAEIDQQGGQADVWILRDLSGKEINAKVVNGRTTAEWVLLDTLGHVTRTRLPYRPLLQADLQKKGYLEACERRSATAMIIFASSGANWPHVEAVVKPAAAEQNREVKASKEHLGERTIERFLRGKKGTL